MRVVVSIAGSDSSAGAGIQADLKTIAANGAYGASVLTAVTAQNTQGVQAAEGIAPTLVRAQIDAIFSDFTVDAVKSGMLGSDAIIATVAEALRERRPPHYVLDPVMVSKSGFPLLPEGSVAALRRELLPLASLVTPNVHEAQALTGLPVTTVDEAEAAGRRILESGAAAVLVKGGHLRAQPATDVLVTPGETRVWPGEWIESPHTHGAGCTYASAIATHLALGRSLAGAIVLAKAYVTEAIRAGLAIGRGAGPTDHFFFLRRDDPGDWLRRLGEAETPA